MQPVLSDPIQCFKALVTIHKLLVNGPPIVLTESLHESGFLEQCARIHSGSMSRSTGYGPLISSYVSFLLTKLDFHRLHQEFTGNFDYEEYLSMKGVQDLDEGYKTIDEMMELQERLDLFQKSVFENHGGFSAGGSECRVSAFVPLIDESYGMYKFVTSMLSAMHLAVDSPDPLILLVERYNKIFYALKAFYAECSKIKYLTSLVAIPQLPDRAPQFNEEALKRYSGPQAFHKAQASRSPPMASRSEPKGGNGHTTVVVQLQQPAQPAAPQQPVSLVPAVLPQMAAPAPQMMYDATLLQRVNEEIVEMQRSLHTANNQHQADQATVADLHRQLDRSEGRVKELADRYNQLVARANAQGDDLRAEIDNWKSKYETCAKLYTELRDKYMQLTAKLSESAKNAQASTTLQIRLHEMEAARLMDAQQLDEKQAQMEVLMNRLATLEGELEAMRAEEVAIGGDLGDALKDEMSRAAEEIAKAAARLAELVDMPDVHVDLVAAATKLTESLSQLIRAAREVQLAIVRESSGQVLDELDEIAMERAAASFYKRNSVWTAGLISAAQAVASATSHLVDNADGLLRGIMGRTPEHLLVSSSGVTASTAQLMAAARVKANPAWPSSKQLEQAAKAVGENNKALVQLVSTRSLEFYRDAADDDGSRGSEPATAQEYRIAEMDQQVEILTLERRLQTSRMRLARLRQAQYERADDLERQQQESLSNALSKAKPATDADDEWISTDQFPALEDLKL